MNVRKAVFDDTDRILRLYHQQYEVMADQQPDLYREAEQERDYVQSIIEQPDADILLLETHETDGDVIGFLLLYLTDRPDRPFFVPHRYVRVADLLVEKFYRGAGWGSLLLDAAADWARARDAEYLEMEVLSNNSRALSFCARSGFTQRQSTWVKPV